MSRVSTVGQSGVPPPDLQELVNGAVLVAVRADRAAHCWRNPLRCTHFARCARGQAAIVGSTGEDPRVSAGALVIPAGVRVGTSVLDECLSCQTSLFEVRALRSAFLSAPP
jgi:hypothetical protein